MARVFLIKKKTAGSDDELLRMFCEEGDIEILGTLYERYMHLVYGVCLKYLDDRDAAKDEVMNIFEKLVTTVPGQEIVNFRTWLYVVTKNHCLMLLRGRKNETVHMEKMMGDPLFFMETKAEMHPLEENDGPDMVKLQDCIEKLREEQRSCIRMFFYDGLSYRQISERTRLDEKKVKSFIQNGKRNLKICIEAQNSEQR